MNPSGSLIFPTGSELRNDQAGDANGPRGTASAKAQRGTLSFGRVSELIADLMARRFYGKLALHFEAGHIVCAKLEQSIKE